ncbi:hypothetical protein BKA67DRAFT_574929 [Truncatella angustata]|uniref:Secreted protein n=1 Tax=Truncatella angustata TaxID=152316 RepID=A0A9P8UEJ6_9PEZI|nr:uncharacterized protein BKA67DRAFT_574929 [Truncatella angustata]KAH6648479.1 hypothetical protein BKA67DRAFT_574929 [Truncatella angustata]
MPITVGFLVILSLVDIQAVEKLLFDVVMVERSMKAPNILRVAIKAGNRITSQKASGNSPRTQLLDNFQPFSCLQSM